MNGVLVKEKQVENKILKVISLHDYKKGLYYKGLIQLNRLIKNNDKTEYFLSVQSENKRYQTYDVQIDINNNAEVINTYCECKQYEIYGSCKHIAASLIYYQNKMFKDEEEEKRQISLDILNRFYEEKKSKFKIRKLAHITVDLEFCDRRYKRYEIRLKIGEDKLYSLNQKLSRFIYAYDNGGTVKFGKNFVYDPDEYYFGEDDTKLIEKLRGIDYYNLHYISEYELHYYLDIIKDHPIYIEGIGNITKWVNGNPYQIELTKEKNNIILNITNKDQIYELEINKKYVVYQKQIYIVDEEIGKLTYLMQYYNLDKLTFDEKDLEKFTGGLLKLIKENVTVSENLKDTIIITNKPTVKLYFDYYYNAIVCNIKLNYNNNEINYFEENDHIVRDSESEEQILNDIIKYDFKIIDEKLILEDIDSIGYFMEKGLLELSEKYEIFTSEKIKNTKFVQANVKSTFNIGKDNILKYQFDLGNINPSEIFNVLEDLKNKKKYYRLKSGDILDLEANNDLEQLDELINDLDLNNKNITQEEGEIPKYRAIYLDYLKKEKYSIITTNNSFDEFIDNFNKYKNAPITLTDKDKQILREYQVTGVKWLYNIYKCNLGGVLADEMGLGKSIQFIYFIKQVIKDKKDAKILIIVPTSLVYNWQNEFEKFGKNLKYKVLYGNKNKREEIFNNLSDYNILITTYGLIREDQEMYENKVFEIVALDEAQNIKNNNAMMTKAVKKIKANCKIALTGTPLENSITELWSIFDFIMPGYLANIKKFNTKYNIKDVDEENINKLDTLKRQIAPFILRRKKQDVLKDLPAKIENNIYVDLNENQKKIYIAEVEKTKKKIDELLKTSGFDKSRFEILTLLTKLRQICISPNIIFENYKYESSKIEELVKIVKEVVSNGHKILIFSSFKTALSLVQKRFQKEKISFYTIDGSVNSKKRMELVNKFNEDDTNTFLITIKAGGTGLNLTSADVVIHLDLWWNPQVENQATDRSHRIGQKNNVEVIKIICKGTIEERILELQNKKKILVDNLIEGKDRDKNIINSLSEKDIQNLLKLDIQE